jgi:hypothetical protein
MTSYILIEALDATDNRDKGAKRHWVDKDVVNNLMSYWLIFGLPCRESVRAFGSWIHWTMSSSSVVRNASVVHPWMVALTATPILRLCRQLRGSILGAFNTLLRERTARLQVVWDRNLSCSFHASWLVLYCSRLAVLSLYCSLMSSCDFNVIL